MSCSARVAVYYTVAEMLTNAAKHAQPSQMWVSAETGHACCGCAFGMMGWVGPIRCTEPGSGDFRIASRRWVAP